MAEVVVTINGRPHTVVCDDGQQAHVAHLGAELDARVRDLAGRVGQVGDSRLVVLAALTMADDLATAQEELQELRTRPEPSLDIPDREARDAAATAERQRLEDALAERLEALAERIEGLASRLEAA